jgi:hypothetical protein
MSSNSTPVHAPWAYESLPDQKTVEDEYIFQIMQSVVLYALLMQVDRGLTNQI